MCEKRSIGTIIRWRLSRESKPLVLVILEGWIMFIPGGFVFCVLKTEEIDEDVCI